MLALPLAVTASAGMTTPGTGFFSPPALAGCILAQKSDAGTHLGNDAGIFQPDGDAHLDGRLGAVGCGDRGDDRTGDIPVRIGIELDGDRLLRPHSIDEVFADVDFNFKRRPCRRSCRCRCG